MRRGGRLHVQVVCAFAPLRQPARVARSLELFVDAAKLVGVLPAPCVGVAFRDGLEAAPDTAPARTLSAAGGGAAGNAT
jgi:hypothetical protein